MNCNTLSYKSCVASVAEGQMRRFVAGLPEDEISTQPVGNGGTQAICERSKTQFRCECAVTAKVIRISDATLTYHILVV